jgi:hypothetical protein
MSSALGYNNARFCSRTPIISGVMSVHTEHRDPVDSTPVSHSGDEGFKSRQADRPSWQMLRDFLRSRRPVIPNLGYAYVQGYEPGHLGGTRKKNWITLRGTYVNIYILNNSNYINHKHYANTKGKIYGNRLPRGTKVKNGWEPRP